jgi:hypothetical protein
MNEADYGQMLLKSSVASINRRETLAPLTRPKEISQSVAWVSFDISGGIQVKSRNMFTDVA